MGSFNYLKELKRLGFQTFSDFWDESYDSYENHGDRLGKIFQLIDYIESLDIETLKSIYVKMQELLEFNQKILLEKIPEYKNKMLTNNF